MIEPLSVTLQALLDNMPGRDDQILIIGGGVIGNLIVQSIRALGIYCPITVAEPSPFHASLVSQAGANHLITDGDILHNAVRIAGARAYKPLLGPEIVMGGFTKIFDTVASTQTLNADLRVLRTGGVLSVVGIGKEVKIDLTPLWLKLQTIKGVYCFGYTDVRGKREHVFEIALDLVKQKKVSLEPMVTHTFPLEGYREMIEVNLHKGEHKAVKTMVRFA
jgi:threonine dehydrogenase-like Zn-dependent dehydrogenase